MLTFWKQKPKRSDHKKLIRTFVRLVITINDTPTLIRHIAEYKQFILYCSATIKAEKNTNLEQLRWYRELKQEAFRQGFSFEKLRSKLATIADAIGLHTQIPKSSQIDHYQILGVSENASNDTIKKAFRAKARLTHPDLSSGKNDEFFSVREAYRILSDPFLRRHYNRIRMQNSHRQWSETSVKEADETLNRSLLRIYGVRFIFIVLLLVGTAWIADFVITQRSVLDDVHKMSAVKKTLPENQNRDQNSKYHDEHNLLEIKGMEHPETQDNSLENHLAGEVTQETAEYTRSPDIEREIPTKKREKTPFEADPNRPKLVENKNTGWQVTDHGDKPDSKDMATDDPLKKSYQAQKNNDLSDSQNLIIEKSSSKNFKVAELPGPKPLNPANEINNTDDISGLSKPDHSGFPKLETLGKIDEIISETLVSNVPLQINAELEQFLSRYCDAYERMDLNTLMTFFSKNAIENGIPINRLLPKYRKNFQNLASITYRISMVNYTLEPNGSTIDIKGVFFLQWRKKHENYWHRYNGDIHLNLISKDESFIDESFKINELSYRFMN